MRLERYITEKTEDKNLYTFKGKPFWSGAYDFLDGHIYEVHPYEEAEEVDFHHSFYFSYKAAAKMAKEEWGFFWFDKQGLNTYWRNGEEAPPKVKKSIMQQVKKR